MNKGKKRHFTESELEIVVNDVETQRDDSLWSPVSRDQYEEKRKGVGACVWGGTCRGVRAAHTHTQVKKKWFGSEGGGEAEGSEGGGEAEGSEGGGEAERLYSASLSCRTLGRPLGGAVFEQIP